MIALPESLLQQLRDAGLFVSQPYQEGHGWEHGVVVGKPYTTKGNFVSSTKFKCGDVIVDAPTVVLYSTGEVWVVLMQQYTPVMGPGDFENLWETPQMAVDDILDFYFGDPARMKLTERH